MEGVRPVSRRSVLLGVAAGLGLTALRERQEAAAALRGTVATASRTSRWGGRAGAELAVACLGCGGHGRQLLKRLRADDRVRIRLVCDPDVDRAEAAARALDRSGALRPRAVTDLREALDDVRIDAVIVAAPHHWHALAAIWALRAGKHVYLEKPATHSLGEGPALLEEWRRSGLVVEVGTQRRSHPGMQEAIAAVHGGEVGQVDHARCYSWRPRPSIGPVVRGTWPGSLDPELWFGPRPIVRPTRETFHYDWHWFVAFGNGGLGNNGVHRLDVARWGLRIETDPDRVLSLGGRLGPRDAGETPNTALTVVTFGDQSVAHDLRGLPTRPHSRLDPGMHPSDEVAFVGEGGSIVVSRTGGRMLTPAGRVVARYGAGAEDADPIARHLRRWVTACLAGDPEAVVVGPREGIAAADMCHLPAEADRVVQREWAVRSAGSDGPTQRSARARDTGRGWERERVRADVESLCGPTMRRPTESFLAHLGRAAARYTGVRACPDVRSAAVPLEYRLGYRLS